ncbi:MAG: UDP-N-acetylmuramoyl-L-alanyl-D-glutamate--2,6-diaminopimelate ligase [Granulosicoccaceae bacterium]
MTIRRSQSLANLMSDIADMPDVMVSGVALDSRLLGAGDLYLAVAGATTHGLAFVEQVINSQAAAVLIDEHLDDSFDAALQQLRVAGIVVGKVPQLKNRVGEIAADFYGRPSQHLNVVAVTGTDGKTSVCLFIATALRQLGHSCGYIGTLGWGVDELASTALTTPDAVSLQRMLAELRAQGAATVALEASSHGISEGRLDDVAIDVAVLTNIGRDHLDYHQTLEHYKAAKAQLFSWPSLRAIVVNRHDELGAELLAESTIPGYAFTSKSASSAGSDNTHALIEGRDIQLTAAGIQFDLVDESQSHTVTSGLFGRFNVENLLACHGVLLALGHAANDSANALGALQAVPGRMEQFSAKGRPTVVVDFAHTPQALQSAIAALRDHADGVLWVVFGCGGDRDKGKRLPMGRAAEAANHVIVTDDNPRWESSQSIIDAILSGMQNPQAAIVIADRREAIAYAITTAAENDVVLIAGKGHEDYQINNGKRLPFSDRLVVDALLQEAC